MAFCDSLDSTHVVTSPDARHSPPSHVPFAAGMCWQGRFELLRALGMGSSGAVFEARDRVTGRSLALKILRRCEPQALSRFKQEFRVLAEIAHPNLVAVHELIVDAEQRASFSMDLVRGRTFLEYVRDPEAGHGCDEPRLRAALGQLVRAVQCLHEHGILHRDLKPANVLMDAAGRLTLVDFGLAQHRSQAAGHGDFEGTPAYAAPEQIASAAFSCQSDWYGVGVMLYEALTGQRPAASAAPAQLSALDEPGVAQDLARLCRDLLAHDPAHRPDGRQLLAALGATQIVQAGDALGGGRAEPPLVVGRAAELARLRAAFDAARAPRSSAAALVLRGPSGIGKTSLAQALLTQLRADPDCLVFSSRCFVHESVHYNAFDGIIDGLASHLQSLSPHALARLTPRGVGALVQLFPALRGWFGPCQVGAANELLRTTAFTALRELLSQLAARGRVVLFLDDLQWADADSAQLLSALLGSGLGPVFLLATWRSDVVATQPLVAALAQFEALQLGPLPPAAAAALVRAQLTGCDGPLASEIVARATGHPLHVWELIDQAREQGLPSALSACALDHALLRRSRGLSEPARGLLELVCVAGRPLASSVLLGAEQAGEQAALRELRAARLTRDSRLDGELSYVDVQHDRVRSALLSQLPRERELALHALLAERLLASGDAGLEQAVQHMLLAGRHQQVGVLAERAAQGAAARMAFHSAAELYLLALAQSAHAAAPTRRRLQLRAAEACARAGRLPQAGGLFEQAARSASSASERVELLSAAMAAYGTSGHGRPARELLRPLRDALSLPASFTPLSVHVGVAWLRGVAHLGLPRLRRRPVAAAAEEPSALSPGAALRLMWRATPSVLVIDSELSCQLAGRTLLLAARQGEPAIYAQSLAFHMAALCLFTGTHSAAVERTFARAQRLVVEHGDDWEQAFVRVMRGAAAAHLWQHARAAALCEDVAASRALSTPYAASVRALARTVYLPSLFQSGGLARGAELAEEYVRDASACGDRQGEFGCRVVHAHTFLRRDQVQEAQAELTAAYALELDYPHIALGDPHWEIDVPLYRGDARAALRRYQQMRAQAGREVSSAPAAQLRFVAVEARCLLACVAQEGMSSELWRALTRCLRQLEQNRCLAARPIAAQLGGSLALRLGWRARGVSQLQAAAARLDALGMPLYAASVRLAAVSGMPRGAAASERAALAVLERAGILAPLRWASMLAPRLTPSSTSAAG